MMGGGHSPSPLGHPQQGGVSTRGGLGYDTVKESAFLSNFGLLIQFFLGGRCPLDPPCEAGGAFGPQHNAAAPAGPDWP